MPFITIDETPLAPNVRPVEIYYRDSGTGAPLVFLHGGWGYQIYPFDRQIEAFSDRFRIVIPDRTGYGRSKRLSDEWPADFHRRASRECLSLIDAIGLDRPVLWGHSDGAVIAALIGLAAPNRFRGLILEAFHLLRIKPGSREFFENLAASPQSLGKRVCGVLAQDHGEDYWEELIRMNGGAWLKIADQNSDPRVDLYNGELGGLMVPTLFIHGSRDPRTEPGEIDNARRQLPRATFHMIAEGGHSPHSETAAFEECNAAARGFLDSVSD